MEATSGNPISPWLLCKQFLLQVCFWYANHSMQISVCKIQHRKNGPLAKEDRRCWLPSNELAANFRFLFLTMYGVNIFLAHSTELFWL